MFETKYSKFLTVLLVIIIVAIIGLFGYLGFSYFRNYKTSDDANQFVSTFVEEPNEEENKNEVESGSIAEGIEVSESNGSSTVKTYKGFNVLGTIEIPRTDVKYPVLEAPPTVKKLEVAVAALYPQNAVLNTAGNVVIVGHNYRNGLFFSNNKKLSIGDKIYITGLDGNKVTYIIYNMFETSEDDTSFYNRDTDGAMEITLSTCTDDSSARTIIEARAE